MSGDDVALKLPEQCPHGGGIEAAAMAWGCRPEDVLDLSTGLHPAGPQPWLGPWLHEHAGLIGHYPDREGEPARSALAAAFSVKPEHVLITAGAQAVIEVLFQAMGWTSMAIQTPCYSEPIRCAKRADCEVRAFSTGQPPQADLLWLTSPANPSGQCHWPPAQASHSAICLDESYMPFTQRRVLGLLPDVIRIGSLTKTFCIPGLRLGYVIADTVSLAQLRAWLPPWPAPTQGLHLLPALLPEADKRDEQLSVARARMNQLLTGAGWQVEPSAASFLLAKPTDAMPDFAKHRILVRQFPEWPQLAGWVRFGLPGTETEWQRLTLATRLSAEKE